VPTFCTYKMLKNFRFSAKISIIGLLLIIGMLRLSYWQWERHLEKNKYIKELIDRLEEPITPLSGLYQEIVINPDIFQNRRFVFEGQFDFEHEFIIKNRRVGKDPGVLVITPLKLNNSENIVLVNRGFLPLKKSKQDIRTKYQKNTDRELLGLLRLTNTRKLFAPKDPNIDTTNRSDEFIRLDLEHISQQLPYKIANFYLELIPNESGEINIAEIVKSDSDKEELLLLPLRGLKVLNEKKEFILNDHDLPYPVLSSVLPSSRHLGYVFEWIVMAIMTFLICLVLQLKRN
jgi:cytochrome oxidase assembly protein ShyY1